MKRITISSLFLIFTLGLFAQDGLIAEFKRHIKYLASDELEGRATGSKGEQLAYEYIIKEFKNSGVLPVSGNDYGSNINGYLQKFDFYSGMTTGASNKLMINKVMLDLNKDYYPVSYTANGSITGKISNANFGIVAPDLNHNDYMKAKKFKNKIFLIDLSNPIADNPHSDFAEYNGINYRIETAVNNGAKAILFYNTNKFIKDPDHTYKIKTSRYKIPVIFLKEEGMKKLNIKKIKKATIAVELNENIKYGHNVLGVINNNADKTIIIGAHYDHLGYGGHGSRYTGGRAIHNGADDNASGVAMMLELADWLKEGNAKSNNYLFIAFSGEEMGLYGSKNFVKNADSFVNSKPNYMLNYDMVGRLNDEGVLSINGTGTSPEFKVLDRINVNGIKKVNKSESGVGPSDHTSFYLNDIPVLHFFTGAHADYHKPEDDEHLINYEGVVSVYEYSRSLIDKLNKQNKLAFSKTKDNNNDKAPKFTVTLGVMPDYTFSGKGLRIDGVTAGKTASAAGIENGDVVIKMGAYPVNDIMSYMEALSKFKRKDKTVVKIKRNDQEMDFDVEFK